MKSADDHTSNTPIQKSEYRKPYVTPKLTNVSVEAAEELLLLHADTSDPEVQQMLQRITPFVRKERP